MLVVGSYNPIAVMEKLNESRRRCVTDAFIVVLRDIRVYARFKKKMTPITAITVSVLDCLETFRNVL